MRLSEGYPDVLINPVKLESIREDIEAGISNSIVFKSLMMVFYPDELLSCNSNAEVFLEMCGDTVDAIKVKKALREKCCDMRFKHGLSEKKSREQSEEEENELKEAPKAQNICCIALYEAFT